MTGRACWFPDPGGGDVAEVLQREVGAALPLHVGPRPPPGRVTLLVEGVPDTARLAALPDLEAVIVPWAGVHPSWREALADRPAVALHNLHHNAEATAEMAVALLLAVWKRLVPCDRALRAGDWRARYDGPPSVRVAGRLVVVVGHGAVGRRVAAALEALGARVVGVRRRLAAGAPDRAGIVAREDLDAYLPEADAVVLAAPATEATENLFDGPRLARLPPRAVLVNVARGRLVDEDALHEALAAGRLAGAGLDAWWRYPRREAERGATPPSRHPFGELPQVVLSPHRAGHTYDDDADRARALARLLLAHAHGARMDHRVDLQQGY